MTIHEYVNLVAALDNSGLADLAGFKVESYHNSRLESEGRRGQWDIILAPVLYRIHLVSEIVAIVNKSQGDIAIYTDINRPGCLVFH